MQHKIEIPPDIIARVIKRCGTPHPFARLDPARTALLVVDMQNGYMNAEVGHSCVPTAPGIVPTINRLAATLRETGGQVYWIQNASDEKSRVEWSVLEDQASPERRAARIRSIAPGTPGHAFWPDLDIRPGDEIVPKYRYSCFIRGASDLEERLRSRGIDTVLITGTLTNVCCESTARDAMMLNFRTIMVSDANAAMTDAEHNASLIAFYLAFGDVQQAAQIEAALQAGSVAKVA